MARAAIWNKFALSSIRCSRVRRFARTATATLHLGLPVRVGGLVVNQGDLLHADANGVTSIPIEIASEVADIGAEFLAGEEIVMSYVKAPGDKSVAKFNELRKEFGNIVAGLTKRVSRKGK